ncbi:unnamed protein product [Bursaphelenchus xylophilus]|uniref:(pine wood nematode) hypothetical protein n=1 Tax=Bursaphelenchus xylophilus TaxID=6326 RepID=A0A1I7S3C1_BURXY|nr:unnamed protein product [Bursaphelenchus xylophilus]CAG9116204.1 unnamed protein product [Bursaphelenchus xylophilus]
MRSKPSSSLLTLEDMILPTTLTVKEVVEDMIKQSHCVNDESDINNIGAAPIHMGFNSRVARVQMYVQNGNVIKAVLKQPISQYSKDLYKPEENSFTKNLCFFHNQEIFVYRNIAPKMDFIRFPKMLSAKESDVRTGQHGYILLEDLGDFGKTNKVIEGMDFQKCANVVTSLAQFHAYSHVLNRKENIFEKMKCAVPSIDLIPFDLFIRLVSFDRSFFQCEEVIRKWMKDYKSMPQNVHLKYGYPAVLAHGDLWTDNILLHGDKVVSILDWQCSHISTGLNDLAKFLFVSARSDVFRDHIHDLFIIYHNTFHQTLTKNGCSFSFTLDQQVEMFKYQAPFEFLFCILIFPSLGERATKKEKEELKERLKNAYNYIRQRTE